MHLLICVDVGEKVGLGHFSRCLVLAQEANRQGWQVSFLVGGGLLPALDSQLNVFSIPRKGYVVDHSAFLTRLIAEQCFDAILMDISHDSTLERYEGFAADLNRINEKCLVALLDSSGANSISRKYPDTVIDILIVPYVGEPPVEVRDDCLSLIGAEFAIIDPVYHIQPVKMIKAIARRVLVTCGGGDPMAVSMKVLDALELCQADLDIQCVIGPYFDEGLIKSLKRFADCSSQHVECVIAPLNLADHMTWADLSISTSGLTKYEFSVTGTPVILLSIDELHHRVNQRFLSAGTAVDLGVYDSVDNQDLSQMVDSVVADMPLRKKMSEAGRRTIDGLGVERIVSSIGKKIVEKNQNSDEAREATS